MKTYLTVEYAQSYGISLQSARRLTDEERPHYTDEYKDLMFVSLGNAVSLPHLSSRDLPMWGSRPSDGCFNGCSNHVWIITQEEWDALLALEHQRAGEAAGKKRQETIEELKATIAKAEAQTDIPEPEEAKRRMAAYNDLYNEGGYGYVPHIINKDEYARAKEQLRRLLGET